MQFKKIAVVIFCLLFSTMILASDPPPLRIMKTTTSQMLTSLRANKSRIHNRKVIYRIVQRVVLPRVDINSVSRSVVGRIHWNRASAASKQRFIHAFTRYVTNMYASAISSYSNEKILFRPMRSYSGRESRVRIYSVIRRPNAPQITLNYRLVRSGSTWKIYDFSIDGVSMVQSYRAQFANALSQGGLTNLTRQLQARNR